MRSVRRLLVAADRANGHRALTSILCYPVTIYSKFKPRVFFVFILSAPMLKKIVYANDPGMTAKLADPFP